MGRIGIGVLRSASRACSIAEGRPHLFLAGLDVGQGVCAAGACEAFLWIATSTTLILEKMLHVEMLVRLLRTFVKLRPIICNVNGAGFLGLSSRAVPVRGDLSLLRDQVDRLLRQRLLLRREK